MKKDQRQRRQGNLSPFFSLEKTHTHTYTPLPFRQLWASRAPPAGLLGSQPARVAGLRRGERCLSPPSHLPHGPLPSEPLPRLASNTPRNVLAAPALCREASAQRKHTSRDAVPTPTSFARRRSAGSVQRATLQRSHHRCCCCCCGWRHFVPASLASWSHAACQPLPSQS